VQQAKVQQAHFAGIWHMIILDQAKVPQAYSKLRARRGEKRIWLIYNVNQKTSLYHKMRISP